MESLSGLEIFMFSIFLVQTCVYIYIYIYVYIYICMVILDWPIWRPGFCPGESGSA